MQTPKFMWVSRLQSSGRLEAPRPYLSHNGRGPHHEAIRATHPLTPEEAKLPIDELARRYPLGAVTKPSA